jgi:hypothetical protein
MKRIWPFILLSAALLGGSFPLAWANSCPACKEARAAAMRQALTTIDAQKPIPANSVVHVYKNTQCENQLGNYNSLLNTLQQLADESSSQTAQTIAQVLQTLLSQTQSACGGSGGGIANSPDTTTRWPTPSNPQNIQNAINPQGGTGNADFQNLFQ